MCISSSGFILSSALTSAGSPRSPTSSSRNPGDLNRSPSAFERQFTADGKKKFVPLEIGRGLQRSNSIRVSASADCQRNLALANGESNANSGTSRGSSFNNGPTSGNGTKLQRASSASSYSVKKASGSSSRGNSFGLSPLGKGALYDPHTDETSSAGSTPSIASLNGFKYVCRFLPSASLALSIFHAWLGREHLLREKTHIEMNTSR